MWGAHLHASAPAFVMECTSAGVEASGNGSLITGDFRQVQKLCVLGAGKLLVE